MTEKTRDLVALTLTLVLGLFLLVSLLGAFILAYQGKAPEDMWAALFSLATAILGGLVGWLAGTSHRRDNGTS